MFDYKKGEVNVIKNRDGNCRRGAQSKQLGFLRNGIMNVAGTICNGSKAGAHRPAEARKFGDGWSDSEGEKDRDDRNDDSADAES